MPNLYQIFGIDEEYDSRMSRWLHELLASSETLNEFLEAVANKLKTMSQLDAFLCGMYVEAFLIYRALLNNPEVVYDQAKRFYETYKKYRMQYEK